MKTSTTFTEGGLSSSTQKKQCEHVDNGACLPCLNPSNPKTPRFKSSMRPWGLEFRGRFLKAYKSLNKILTETAESNWSDFMIVSPTGVKFSIEVGRLI